MEHDQCGEVGSHRRKPWRWADAQDCQGDDAGLGPACVLNTEPDHEREPDDGLHVSHLDLVRCRCVVRPEFPRGFWQVSHADPRHRWLEHHLHELPDRADADNGRGRGWGYGDEHLHASVHRELMSYPLKYLFRAHYDDGSSFQQNEADTSVT